MSCHRAAVVSPCTRYRYVLERQWRAAAPAMTLVMLNPSTADASKDDPTITRCIGFALREAYGGIRVLNLFALRATDPGELAKAADPIGPDNDVHLRGAGASRGSCSTARRRGDDAAARRGLADPLAPSTGSMSGCRGEPCEVGAAPRARCQVGLLWHEPMLPFAAKAGVA